MPDGRVDFDSETHPRRRSRHEFPLRLISHKGVEARAYTGSIFLVFLRLKMRVCLGAFSLRSAKLRWGCTPAGTASEMKPSTPKRSSWTAKRHQVANGTHEKSAAVVALHSVPCSVKCFKRSTLAGTVDAFALLGSLRGPGWKCCLDIVSRTIIASPFRPSQT